MKTLHFYLGWRLSKINGWLGCLLLTVSTLQAVTVTGILPPNGSTAGGTSVTLVGTGFTNATAVSIGGVTSTGLSVINATMMTAITGAHATGTVDVEVTTPGGSGAGSGLYAYGVQLSASGAVWTEQATAGVLGWQAIASSADGSKLAAVEGGGQIYTSSDFGLNWTAQDIIGNWMSVCASADGSRLAAVESSGQIYTSTDSGATWTARDSVRNWQAITCSADGSKLAAVESGGHIYTSTNSGLSWTARDSIRNWQAITCSADGSKLAAAVYGGKIYTSLDSGTTWTPRDSARSWQAITSSADGSKLAAVVSGVASGGQIYTSSDSGATWTPRESARFWQSITSSADGSKLAAVVSGVASGGKIYTSTNSGANWSAWDSDRHWMSICSSADGSRLAAAEYGGLIYTSVGENPPATPPTVINPTSAGITFSSATLGGTVTNDGGATLTVCGVAYAPTATNNNPQLGGTGVTVVTGSGATGVFTLIASSLTPSTAYTFKAYATNSAGTAYSSAGSFTTPISNNADLANLTLSAGTLSPDFASGTISYTAFFANTTTSIQVTPTVADGSATVMVNNVTVTPGSASGSISLNVGTNPISCVVTAHSGTTKTYTIIVTRGAPNPLISNNADLASLELSDGSLSPDFASATLEYAADVHYYTYSTILTATASEPHATIAGTGEQWLDYGYNTFEVVVTAQDGITTKTYTVSVYRYFPSTDSTLHGLSLSVGTLSPAFDSATANYTASVPSTTASITVDAGADGGATITGAGTRNLEPGVNTLQVTATAQNYSSHTYTIVVIRGPTDLTGIVLSAGALSPAFDRNITSYSITEPWGGFTTAVTPTAANPEATITVNGVVVPSGTASAPIWGTITCVVTAPGWATKTYTVSIIQPPPPVLSSNADLSNLVLGTGTLTPAFVSTTTTYTAEVPFTTTTMTLTPTVADSKASVKVNTVSVISGNASGNIALNVGSNPLACVITAEDGTTKTYTVTVTRTAPSTEASLGGLSLSEGSLSPAFDSNIFNYTASVASTTDSVTVFATGYAFATVSGAGSHPLVMGPNSLAVTITSQAGNTHTYALVVTRGPADANLSDLTLSTGMLSPVFASSTTSYSTSVSNGTGTITVTPTAVNPFATVRVNDTVVISGSGSGAITLGEGSNSITCVVTAQDGITKTYTINVVRSGPPPPVLSGNADLSDLALSEGTLSPAFVSGTTEYTAIVPYIAASVTVSATVSEAHATVLGTGNQTLNPDSNTVLTVRVTAEDGTIKTYTVTVSHADPYPVLADRNADLAELALNEGMLNPSFSSGVTLYTTLVPYLTASVTLTATACETLATVAGSGMKVIDPNISTVLTVRVTAPDRATTKDYTVVVRHADPPPVPGVDPVPSANADLADLLVSEGPLSPTFSSNITDYTVTVPYETTAVTVIATPDNDHATLTGAGNQMLDPGTSTLLTVQVTAQDKVTTKAYTVIVSRAPPDTSLMLASLDVSGGALSPDFESGITHYTVSVPNTTTGTTVTAIPRDVLARVSGTGSQHLDPGINPLIVQVTGPNGSTMTYTVMVARREVSVTTPKLTSSTATAAMIGGDVTIDDGGAAIIERGVVFTLTSNYGNLRLGASGNASCLETTGPFSVYIDHLTPATGYIFAAYVTNSAGTTYSPMGGFTTLSNNANLTNLALSAGTLSPAFASDTTSYTAHVPGTTTSIKVIPTVEDDTARVLVNDKFVTSGCESDRIALHVGENLISIEVIAQDRTAKSYMVSVTRAAAHQHTATLLANGQLLVVGGSTDSNALGNAQLFNPATGTWNPTSSLGTGRNNHSATLLPNGKVLVVAGRNGGGGLIANAESYDPATGSWSADGDLATARESHTATLLPDGKVLVAGGNANDSGDILTSSGLFDPATGIWSVTGPLVTGRVNHTATLLSNGKVLVAGGNDSDGSSASAELYDPATGIWSATGNLGTARQHHTATLLPDGKVLVAGGDNNNDPLDSAELYDPITGIWSPTGNLVSVELYDPITGSWNLTSTACASHTATLLPNGKVLITGGWNHSNSNLANMELYDPATGVWSSTYSLATARNQHTATLLPNGTVLIAGGTGVNANPAPSTEFYNPAIGTWSATDPMAAERELFTATLLPNGRLLVAGGSDASGTLADAELYDPATGTWSATDPLATARLYHSATRLPNGKVLVAGGCDLFGVFDSAEIYDPATGHWSATGTMVTPRQQHTATLLEDGRVLVTGGFNIGSIASAEIYNPVTGMWGAADPLVTARYLHTATLLPNGKVLVAGGVNNNTYLASAELFDPATGSWSPTGSLVAAARYSHTATLLPNGNVLVAGGWNNTDGNLTSTELYNPETGTWSAGGVLSTARQFHTATLLSNGKVLVAGGSGTGGHLASAELYDPASGFWHPTGDLATAREYHTATLLPNDKVLVAGGTGSNDTLASAELYDIGLGFFAAWRPVIASAAIDATGRLILTGSGFRGISSASGGNGAQDSPTNYPLVQLRGLDNEPGVFLLSDPATRVSDTAFTSVPVSTFPGYARATVVTNGIPSAAFNVYLTLPLVSMPTSANVTTTSATLGGNVTSDGGKPITARGVVWSQTRINSNPRLGGTGVTSLTTPGTTGVFTVDPTGLTLDMDYTFAAFATTSEGTGYSSTGNFPTQAVDGAQIVVAQPADTNLAVGDTRNFGNVGVGASSSLTFTLGSSGLGTLRRLALTVTGPQATAFSVAGPGNISLTTGQSATFTVRFAPSSAGLKTATLHIASNDPNENPFDIVLVGTGDAPPTFSPVTLASNNSHSAWAKTGDTVTLSFTASEPIHTPVVKLLGVSATVANPNANHWTATATVGADTAQGPAAFTINATDLAGIASAAATATTDASRVRVDKTAPTMNVPANMKVPATGLAGAAVTFTPSATDNLDPSPVVTASAASGSMFPIGTTPVMVTATDAAGNSSPARFFVTITPQPHLVKDLFNGEKAAGCSPKNFCKVGSTLFFTATDATHGRELWKSDGTAAGTVLVKDIHVGISGDIDDLTAVGNTLYFRADDGIHGKELWKSDGTAAGTVLVKDIWAGPGSGASNVSNGNGDSLTGMTAVENTLYFQADDGIHGKELWKSDGTDAGTVLVKDIQSGSGSSSPRYLTALGSTLYFLAGDGIHGDELWKSDGSDAGTVLVKDIWVGSGSGSPFNLTVVESTLFFAADDGIHGYELWKSDGSAAGTVLVKDINAGAGKGSLSGPTARYTGSFPTGLTAVGMGNTLYFAADDGIHGKELWKSDGTADGTVLVGDIVSGSSNPGSNPHCLTVMGSTLYFTVSGDGYYTRANGIWKTDGTRAGTVMVSNDSAYVYDLTVISGTLYFIVPRNADYHSGLWKSDGTHAGTVRVKDINISDAGNSHGMTAVGNTLYFQTNDGIHGPELWKSNGTDAGTSLVKDINTGTSIESNDPRFSGLTAVGSTLYFQAYDSTHGGELWKSNGTAAGTVLFKDIYPGNGSSHPAYMTTVEGTLYFSAGDSIYGNELWKSDGTAAGTVLVKDIMTGSWNSGFPISSDPDDLTAVGSTLYFRTYDWTHGYELWKSDGTTAGTILVKDTVVPYGMTAVGNTLYFSGGDAIHGYELWKSDGTEAGTVLVKDIWAGSVSGVPFNNLTAAGGMLYFTANDGTHGEELWQSDGTAAGTVQVADLTGDSGGSSPTSLTVVGSKLYFLASTEATGRGLFVYDLPAPDIVVEQSAQPLDIDIADGDTGDFGSVAMGTNASLTFTLWNPGAADLTGLAITKDGTHGDDFTVGSLGATTLAPGAQTSFTVTFSPGATGTRSAALHIASNMSGAKNPFDIALTGIGDVPPTLGPVTLASNNSNPAWAKAGDTVTLSFTASKPIQAPVVTLLGVSATVANPNANNWTATATVGADTAQGPAAFAITATDLEGVTAADVTATMDASVVTVDTTVPTLSVPANITVPAISAAGAAVSFSASASDNLDPSPAVIASRASGSIFPIGVTTVNVLATDAAGNSATASFSVTVENRTHAPVFANAGSVPLTCNGFTATGLTVGTLTLGFNPTRGQVLMLVNNTSANPIVGRFSDLPNGGILTTTYGGRSLSFVASYTGGDGNDLTLTLLGPEIAVDQPGGTYLTDGSLAVSFGTVGAGSSAARTFTIRNAGSADLSLGEITKDGANPGDFTLNTTGMATTVTAGTSTTFSVTFAPTTTGTKFAALHISSNDAGQNPFDIALSGTGTDVSAPVVQSWSIAPESVDLSGGSQWVAIQVRITDPSGFSSGRFDFMPPGPVMGPQGYHAWGDLSAFDRVSGTPQDGVYLTAILVPRELAALGTWQVNGFELTDTLNNTAFDTDVPAGSPPSFEATGDLNPPVIQSWTLAPGTVEVNAAPGVFTMDIRVTDTGGGFSSGYLNWQSVTDWRQYQGANFDAANRISGTAQDGIYRTTVTIPQNAAAGIWFLTSITATDGPNTTTLSQDWQFPPGSPATLSVTNTPPGPKIAVEQPVGTTLASGATSGFGTVTLGGTSSKVFTIRNAGTASLHLGNVTVTGLNAASFALTTTGMSAQVAPGDLTEMLVAFNPAAGGTCSAVLQIPSNDPDNGTFALSLTGSGNNPPALTLPATPIVVEATGASGAAVTFTVTASDLEDGALTPSASPPSSSIFPVGSTTVNVSATDSAGATTNGTFSVTVRDTTPPVISLVGANPVTLYLGTSYTDPGATATDAVSGITTVTPIGSVDTWVLGPATLTYTTTDDAGNTATATRTVNVVATPLWAEDFLQGIDGSVKALLDVGSVVYVGGAFHMAGGLPANNVACWDKATRTWSPVGGFGMNGTNGTVNALVMIGPDLYVGGQFTTVSSDFQGNIIVRNIAKWNPWDFTWTPLGDPGLQNGTNTNSIVYAMAAVGLDLYVGGTFTTVSSSTQNSISARGIAKWNFIENTWSPLGSTTQNGTSGTVRAMALTGSDLYVGGTFTAVSSSTQSNLNARNVAKWNVSGNAWSPLGIGTQNGTSGTVNAVAAAPSGVYVAGSFPNVSSSSTQNGASAKNIARWNTTGNNWSALGTPALNGTGSSVAALAVCGTDLYAGGAFITVSSSTQNAITADRIAKWDSIGSTWTPLGNAAHNGTNSPVNALATGGSDLDVGGDFATVSSVTQTGILSIHFGIYSPIRVPEIAVEQPIGTNLADGASRNFGSVGVGQNVSLTFTIRNTGTANLTGLAITLDGTAAADYSVTSFPEAPVSGPSGSTTFSVQFSPTTIGVKTAALHIASNDADKTPFDIALSGTCTDASPPVAVSWSIAPSTVDLSGGSSAVELQVRITDASGFSSGRFDFTAPKSIMSGGFQPWVDFNAANRVSGTAQDGIYSVTLMVPRDPNAVGTWHTNGVQLTDTLNNSGFATEVPTGSPPTFEATGDLNPPVIQSWTVTPGTVEVNAAPGVFTMDIRITDTGGGFNSGSLTWQSPDWTQYQGVNFAAANRISGTALDGIYRATVAIPQGTAAGIWFLASITATDGPNTTTLNHDWQYPPNSPATLIVTNTPGVPAAGGGFIYVGNSGTIGKYSGAGTVVNAALVSSPGGTAGMAVADGKLYASFYNADAVSAYTTAGTSINPSLVAYYGANKLAILGTDLFVTSPGAGSVGKFTTAGTQQSGSLIAGLQMPGGIATDGLHLYVADHECPVITQTNSIGYSLH